MSDYLNLVAKRKHPRAEIKAKTSEETMKDAIVHFAANLDSSENIYRALHDFISEHTEDLDRRSELLDTIAFCEADEADLESTLIKLKIALDNPVLSEAVVAQKALPKWLCADNIETYKDVLKGPLRWQLWQIKQNKDLLELEKRLLAMQDLFFNNTEDMSMQAIEAYSKAFDYLWDLLDRQNQIDNLMNMENNKMIDKDFLINESNVTKAVENNRKNSSNMELDPVRCFVVLDKNDMPMLNKGGIVITNTPDADEQIQARADDLYRLIHNAKAVYMIEDDAYDTCVNIRDKKEYVKFVKANGRLIKPSANAENFVSSDVDDDDFLVNVDEMFE